MVIVHLSANADGIRRAVEAAARGETGEVYPGGKAARDAEIEAGRALPARELQARLQRILRATVVRSRVSARRGLGSTSHRDLRGSAHRPRSGRGKAARSRGAPRRPCLRLRPRRLAFRVGYRGDGAGDAGPSGPLAEHVAVVLTASDAGQHWVAGSGDLAEISRDHRVSCSRG